MINHFRYARGGSVPSKSGAQADRAHVDFSAGTPAAGEARETARAHRPPAEAGSALLIVLGFLSFMMISAVSFAVYMRIERQASSNYRHATTARHLLNAGLSRAIDDVDEELRNPFAKFPDWPGRVAVSYDASSDTNSMNARVLSLEALSFVPGIFVNDLRRYAVPNDTTAGAKWRTISMPGNMQNGASVDVGRYAFACVNISDMLDVNVCKASVRDSVTNRVSIGHLFATDAQRKAFDDKVKSVDIRYETLQDFYACMYQRRKDTGPETISSPKTDTPFGSPYHSFINFKGESSGAFFFDLAESHILCTDSIVKAEPTTGAQPCNIRVTQPVAAGVLAQTRTASAALQGEFQTAIGNALAGQLPAGATAGSELMATMIADYIDTDSIPKSLNMPSVERVPMVSQILVPAFFAPTVVKRSVPVVGAVPAKSKDIYSIQLMGDPATARLDVELVWPFKSQKDRTPQPAFKVAVEAYFKVIKKHEPKKAKGFMEPPLAASYIPLTGTAGVPDFWNKDTSQPANCYNHIQVPLTTPDMSKLTIDMIDSEDGVIAGSGFTEHDTFSVALLVFVSVLSGSDVVDRVPQLLPYPGVGNPIDEFVGVPKIFFQTVASAPIEKTMVVNMPIKYEWSCLEVPDPRFNYKAGNWIKNEAEAGATITAEINPSTEALLGQQGRDGDIYMSVSDVGVLQSPGELGFIVRPFPQEVGGKTDIDFRTQDTVDNSEDKEYMFRTIRLYDHGDPADKINCAHDLIYENFTANNADGTVVGARVNPLSDLPQVLIAAVVNTPTDYYWAGNKLLPGGGLPDTTVRKYVFDQLLGASSWSAFTNGWAKCMVNAKKTSPLNTSLTSHLSDVYGTESFFGWYSKRDAEKIFAGGYSVAGVPATLSDPLYEIDRKMLYSFSLESFSDRQQLFLYILRAEATVPTFGGSTDSGVKSLAGGRAVALVWRDPYPLENAKVADFHQHRILYFKQLDN